MSRQPSIAYESGVQTPEWGFGRFPIFDGAMGTALLARGFYGDPVLVNASDADAITEIHREYIHAGATVITTNTFGAYCHKYENAAALIQAATGHAKAAIRATGAQGKVKVALDMGPLGEMLAPFGDMTQEDAYAIFLHSAEAGAQSGADLILIETFFCTAELEAAVRASKTTGLPVFATMTFDKNGRTVMGTSIGDMVNLLEGLGVDALGMNCGFGPEAYKNLLPELLGVTQLPALVQPNAGLPEIVDGKMVYAQTPEEFAQIMKEISALGCTYLGGCCGTTPAHIAAMVKAVMNETTKIGEAARISGDLF